MGPHLAIRIFILVKFWISILGLDIYELSDLIIFHDNHKYFRKKKFANALDFSSFPNPSPFKADFGPMRLDPICLANYPQLGLNYT